MPVYCIFYVYGAYFWRACALRFGRHHQRGRQGAGCSRAAAAYAGEKVSSVLVIKEISVYTATKKIRDAKWKLYLFFDCSSIYAFILSHL